MAAYARRLYKLEKQPPGRVLQNSCFEKFKEEDFQENIRGSIFFLVLLSKIFYHKCFLRPFIRAAIKFQKKFAYQVFVK